MMSDENKSILAKEVYNTVCKAVENLEWKYEKEEEKLIVHLMVQTEDLPILLIIEVDENRQLIRVLSPLPFEMSEDKRMEGAIAACVASYRMADGSFDYDLSDGKVVFRMTSSFIESTIGVELVDYLIGCTCAMIDKYNDKFFAINKGYLSISDFIADKD